MSALPILTAAAIHAVATTLRITDRRTGASTKWVPNSEQAQVWAETERSQREGRWLNVAKPRQIGSTTAATLDVVLWVATCDYARHRVRAAVVVDTADKCRERAAIAGTFVAQLKLKATCNTERITFSNGSVIDFVTAGGERLGASGSYQRLVLSEMSFWPSHNDTYGSLLATLSLDGFCLIESTIDVAGPSGKLARKLWDDDGNRFNKVFFSVEDQAMYRCEPNLITDDEWAWSQKQGFTMREAASWWHTVAVRDLAAGDQMRAMREFPQIEPHMFSASTALWIQTRPPIATALGLHVCGDLQLPYWRAFSSTSRQLVIGVDTAAGKDKDRSAVVVLDKKDNFICASFTDGTITTSQLAALVADLFKLYSQPASTDRWGIKTNAIEPTVVVEDNGIGQSTVDKLRDLGVPVTTTTSDVNTKYQGLLAAKEAIMAGTHGPADLVVECDELHRDEHGNWKGRKDTLVALGFCLLECKRNPYVPPVERKVDVVDGMAIIRNLQRSRSSRW